VAAAKVVLERRLSAPPPEVFEACTRPEIMAEWLGPRAFSMCEVEADVRVGGTFSFRMKGEKGVYGARGVYRAVDPPRRLQLAWTWTEGPQGEEPDGVTSLVTFDLAPDGEGTLLTLTHEGLPDRRQADSHESGWSESLDKLERTLEGRSRGGAP
jgi:uncharacterized protein YndB with AHSA1/START domain